MHRVSRNCINSIFVICVNCNLYNGVISQAIQFPSVVLLYDSDLLKETHQQHRATICLLFFTIEIFSAPYQVSFTNISTKASTTLFCNSTADFSICLNGHDFQITSKKSDNISRKKNRYIDVLSLRLIQSVLNQLKDNFEKSCQSVNVVNILDVIGKKLF